MAARQSAIDKLKVQLERSQDNTDLMFPNSSDESKTSRSALPIHVRSHQVHLMSKVFDEYRAVKDLHPSGPLPDEAKGEAGVHRKKKRPSAAKTVNKRKLAPTDGGETAIIQVDTANATAVERATSAFNKRTKTEETKTLAVALRRESNMMKQEPKWHPQWKLMRVISGHLGWVRCVAVEPGNEWFATGSADRTIKIWDLASGKLKLTLTNHINTVRGLVVSPRHPYMFSVSDDRTVKCWDLETNQILRHYHGHLSGVYSVALHPTLDLLISGSRDSSARVWDIRTKKQVHLLGGHDGAVSSILCQGSDPQIVTGSMDSTIRLWDLAAGKSMATLTNHKKGVRALALHPTEFTFASASADSIKKWHFPAGHFLDNFDGHDSIINTISINEDNVMFTGGDDGSINFWDWDSGYNFQSTLTKNQPGSIDGEAAIYASTFDRSGSRLITCEGDKTIKIWKEDEQCSKETHPITGWNKYQIKKHY